MRADGGLREPPRLRARDADRVQGLQPEPDRPALHRAQLVSWVCAAGDFGVFGFPWSCRNTQIPEQTEQLESSSEPDSEMPNAIHVAVVSRTAGDGCFGTVLLNVKLGGEKGGACGRPQSECPVTAHALRFPAAHRESRGRVPGRPRGARAVTRDGAVHLRLPCAVSQPGSSRALACLVFQILGQSPRCFGKAADSRD